MVDYHPDKEVKYQAMEILVLMTSLPEVFCNIKVYEFSKQIMEKAFPASNSDVD
jgi:hypothetical protein